VKLTCARERDPVNALYDHAAALVEAAAALRRTAGDPRGAPAAPAVLGCVETALRELRDAAAGLDRAGASHGARRDLAVLGVALDDASAAAAAARSSTSRG
jgi:hypothetical protein